ncbi:MAG: phosphopyruvate hydratase [Candidatus Levybacteria bacterium]|nr:phosphopyruvate hydratase [Candidatus Levybacteria bacterium]
MGKIKQLIAREILNAKGNPTVEVTVVLNDGVLVNSSSPSGGSIGTFEALELRDQDPNRYGGMGVLKAISNINNIIEPKLIGIDANKQQEIDKIMIELDGTQNKSHLGANAILAVSMAVAKAAAKSSSLPLFLYLRQFLKTADPPKIPVSLVNLINGGKHAGNNLDFEGFLLIPASSKQYSESLQISVNVYNSLRKTLEAKNLHTMVGDEGGFGPNLATNEDAFAYIMQAIDNLNLRFGFDVFLGLDLSANVFSSQSRYKIKDNSSSLSATEIINYYENITKNYHLLYLEDPLAEDDWDGWVEITAKLSDQVIIAGDDLTSTNPYRLQMALDKKAISGIVIKPSQIGTVIESLAVVEAARQAGLKIIVSTRGGETNDDFIADFAVAVSADYTKFGAPVRGENSCKFNRLLGIEEQLKSLRLKTE